MSSGRGIRPTTAAMTTLMIATTAAGRSGWPLCSRAIRGSASSSAYMGWRPRCLIDPGIA